MGISGAFPFYFLLPTQCLTGYNFIQGKVIDEGDEVASFFSEVLGERCRLVRMKEKRNTDEFYTKGIESQTSFADGFPYTIASMKSLELLNELGSSLPMNRFRANIVVDNCAKAFEEDLWATVELHNSSVKATFMVVKPCSRCKSFITPLNSHELALMTIMYTGKVTTVNQITGKVEGVEPLKSLTKIHSGSSAGYGKSQWSKVPFFSWNAISEARSIIEEDMNMSVIEMRRTPADFP